MELLLGEGWKITPAGGLTGEAYYAQKGGESLFIKRNSSPFLAVLSAEGIVPKLLWTRRLENGDVITAQRWINGRELKSFEMKEERVTQLLKKIHCSKELLEMLIRMGNKPLTPQVIVNEITKRITETEFNPKIIEKGLSYLQEQISEVKHHEYVVCHCDINHNNWVLSEENELFLIDWDGAMVADPALDLGLLLYGYIPVKDWCDLLSEYGVKLDEHLSRRMHWYVVSQTIYAIFWHKERQELSQLNYWKSYLAELLEADLPTYMQY